MSKLPSAWARVQLRDVTTDCEQRVPEDDERLRYIDIASIDRETKRITDPAELLGKDAPSRARKIVRAGDVLVSMTRPNLNAVALVPRELDGQFASTAFDVLRARGVDERWLFYAVRTPEFVARMSELVQGALYPAVRAKDVRGFEAPLAPLQEQKRIADMLDALLPRIDACRGRLQRVLPILKRFRQAVLLAATSGQMTEEWRAERGIPEGTSSFEYEDAAPLGDYAFPASWRQARLGDIASIVGGVTKDSKKQLEDYEELPYLRVANVQRGFLDLHEIKTIRVPRNKLAELLLTPGDILFNEGGDIDKLGRGWIWGGELERCTFQNHVFRARLSDPAFTPRFFSWYGNSRGHDYFLARGKQTTNLASINKSVLSALPVPVPPADEQLEITRRVEALFAYADRLEHHSQVAAARVEGLTPALLSKAFRGELVPQHPADEPASILLERIRATPLPPRQAKPKRAKPLRRAAMSQSMTEPVRNAIRKMPHDSFSFEELRKQVTGNYDDLKDAVFELLSESQPVVKQVFDPKARALRFVRVNP